MMSTLQTATRHGLNLGQPQTLRSYISLLGMGFFVQNYGQLSGIMIKILMSVLLGCV
jgi:hypothetical protein